MVDAVKILGALLGGGGMSSGSGADILKSVVGAAMSSNQNGGLGELLGSVLGGSGQGNNPLGSILGGLAGGQGGQNQSSGGLGELMGGILGGNSSNSAGGMQDLLGGLMGSGSGGQGMDLGSVVGAALNQFGNNQQAAQQNVQPRNFSDHSPDLDYDQTNHQATLLLKAAQADGQILAVGTLGGMIIQAGQENLVQGGNPRSEALWVGALDELEHEFLIQAKGSKREVFSVTTKGYKLADALAKSAD